MTDRAQKFERLGRNVKGLGNKSLADIATWPTPLEGALSNTERSEYLNRKKAVELYLRGESEQVIRLACGIGLKQVYRLITERCLQIHPDGLIYGWRALVPQIRIRPYKRKTKLRVSSFGHGAAGAMNAILDLHPDLRKAFDKRILATAGPKELGPAAYSGEISHQ